MATKKRAAKKPAPSNPATRPISISQCSIQMGPSESTPLDVAAVVALATASESLARAIEAIAVAAKGSPIHVYGHGISVNPTTE